MLWTSISVESNGGLFCGMRRGSEVWWHQRWMAGTWKHEEQEEGKNQNKKGKKKTVHCTNDLADT